MTHWLSVKGDRASIGFTVVPQASFKVPQNWGI